MRIFADTSFWIAFLIAGDPKHDLAHAVFSRIHKPWLVTSELVLVEALNYASGKGPGIRHSFGELSEELLELNFGSTCVRQSERLLRGSLDLYRRRQDKMWSLVDCTSFVIMQELGIAEALTADHHFEQAGFKILLK